MMIRTNEDLENATGRSLSQTTIGATKPCLNTNSTKRKLATAEVKGWAEAPQSTFVYKLAGVAPITTIGHRPWEMVDGPGKVPMLDLIRYK